MMKKVSTVLLLSSLFLVGCGTGESTDATNDAHLSKDKKGEVTKIVAVGSTALQPLVEAAQTEFVAKNANYDISVQGGGSGTGLSQVATGAVTIGNSDVFAEEKEGIDADKLVDHKVAVVGMAPVVNKEVGIKDISQQQLVDIFTGKVKNWKELGGEDQEINVINRASGSGTRTTFEKWALDGQESIQTQEQDSSGTIKKIVAETPGAVSYLALSYLDDSLEALSIDGVKPTPEAITTNDWKIWSYEHMYTDGTPNAEVKKFLDYIVTDEVQNGIVKDLGFLPIKDMKIERSTDGKVTELK